MSDIGNDIRDLVPADEETTEPDTMRAILRAATSAADNARAARVASERAADEVVALREEVRSLTLRVAHLEARMTVHERAPRVTSAAVVAAVVSAVVATGAALVSLWGGR